MLRGLRRTHLAVIALLTLSACSTPPAEAPQPLDIEASYRLLFNDTLVGNSLFTLKIGSDATYRFDVFTTPAGQMAKNEDHEVLESSEGSLDSAGVRPARFDHSEIRGGQVSVTQQIFDRDARRHLRQADGQSSGVPLADSTQDRLSYLLLAHRLANTGDGKLQLQIAGPAATEASVLEVVGATTVETPAGSHQATGVRRVSPETGETRTLWFAAGPGPLPVRIVQHNANGDIIDMQLESFTRTTSDPH